MKKEKGIALISLILIIIFTMLVVLSIGLFVQKSNKDDGTNDVSANVAEKVENNEKKEHYVLYDGVEINIKPGVQNIFDTLLEVDETDESRYNTTFYNYEKGKYTGETTGKYEYEPGYQFVENVGKIAISDKYDAMPRKSEKLNEIPEELDDLMDYAKVEIEAIDLDGDGEKEYIVVACVDYREDEIGDGEPQASSIIMLVDSKFNKVADLVILEDGFTSVDRTEESKFFMSADDVIYIDIDNDGIMEIVSKVPTYEETQISIVKYANGKLQGETNVKGNVLP